MGVIQFAQAELIPTAINYLRKLADDLEAGKVMIHEIGLNVTPVGEKEPQGVLSEMFFHGEKLKKPVTQVDAFSIRAVRIIG